MLQIVTLGMRQWHACPAARSGGVPSTCGWPAVHVDNSVRPLRAPFGVAWDTTTAANGVVSLTAKAIDLAGNSRTSAAVSVTVSN